MSIVRYTIITCLCAYLASATANAQMDSLNRVVSRFIYQPRLIADSDSMIRFSSYLIHVDHDTVVSLRWLGASWCDSAVQKREDLFFKRVLKVRSVNWQQVLNDLGCDGQYLSFRLVLPVFTRPIYYKPSMEKRLPIAPTDAYEFSRQLGRLNADRSIPVFYAPPLFLYDASDPKY
ncbi:MAG: hypothetical protein MUF62_13645 [Chitinophagaceae bacterium]|nr:hypothetical protein [Chitinophagaceae bacterium]